MENASKALIIAGAILLSILIISLGIFIFQQAKGAVDTDQLSGMQADTFNNKLEPYIGTNIRGAQVNALVGVVNSNNLGAEAESVIVTLEGATAQTGQTNIYQKNFKTGSTYTVTIESTTKAGYIDKIKIQENT